MGNFKWLWLLYEARSIRNFANKFRLKRGNLSNFFNRYINPMLVKIIFDSWYFAMQKKKRNHRCLINNTILHKSPQHRNLCPSTSAFHTPFFLPPSFITGTVLSPSILLPNPFPRLYGTRGFVSAILYRRPISIRIDPPDREGGFCRGQASDIFSPGNIKAANRWRSVSW